MNVRTALQQGTELLREASLSARLDAETLLAHALRRDRVWLFAHPEDELDRNAWIHYGRYLHERLQGKPTQYITKRQEFYGRSFRVTPAVLIPRPETEHVVEAALKRVGPGSLVVDVGTGSGAIAVTLALESAARVLAVDLSFAALQVASANARSLGAEVAFGCGDLIGIFRANSLDTVVSNPPYVSWGDKEGLQREVRNWEPHLALFAGDDGNTIYRRLIDQSETVLKPGGFLILELGYRSLGPVQDMLKGAWQEIKAEPDLAGVPRVLSARWNG
jgi:release factor glutamine methyltransferase